MIYLLGGSGFVGQAYQALLRNKGLVFKSPRRADLDYYHIETLAAALKADRVKFLINAAGYTGKPNVDACELHKEECFLGNVVLPSRIAAACQISGIPWGHVSSGCIYTGIRPDGVGFHEDDPPNFSFRSNNCSFYSGTKALGEEVLAGCSNLYIWRLRIPFDHLSRSPNYLAKIMRYEKLLDVDNSLSELNEFVAATLACWEKKVPFGTYNVTNPGHITTREVVELIKESRVCVKDFAFFENEAQFMRVAAKTPRSSCILDTTKLAATGIKLTSVREAIARDLRNWQ